MNADAHVRDVSVEDFERSVIKESQKRPVVVDFWAAWCGPCRALGPILEKLAAEFGGDFLLAKVDTETNAELAGYYGIRSIPNVKVFKNGAIVDEMIGALPESEVRRFLRRHCPSRADRKFAEGMDLVAKNRFDNAHAALEEALQLDPAHAAAAIELGKLFARSGESGAAAAMWDRVTDTSELWEQVQILKKSLEFQTVCVQAGGREAAAARAQSAPRDLGAHYEHGCCLVAAGEYRAALDEFLFVVSREREFRDHAARKAMLTVFHLIGERSEMAEEYRKKLAMALF